MAKVEDKELRWTRVPRPIRIEPVVPAACWQSGALIRNLHDPMEIKEIGVFHLAWKPTVSPEVYLWELLKKMQSDTCILVLAWVYIDRFVRRTHYQVDELSYHRLFLAGVVLAHMWSEDSCYSVAYLSRSGGVIDRDLSKLIVAMCIGTDWHLWVDECTFILYRDELGF